MGARERRRGAQAERELAAILSDALGVTVKRKLGQARDSGDDVQVGRLRIEVKRCERLAIPAWTRQVEKACGVRDIPIVAYRQDGEPWRIVVRLDDALPWLREEVLPPAPASRASIIRCLRAAEDRIRAGDDPREVFQDFGWTLE